MAGLNVRFRLDQPGHHRAHHHRPCPAGEEITLEPLVRSNRRLGLKDFDPCTILAE